MSTQPDDFYVGYLPVPGTYRRAVVAACVLVLGALAITAATLGATLRDGGNGVWDTGHEVTLSGDIAASPYPHITLDDGTTVFLVEAGKKGAQERIRLLGDGSGTCRGWAITRDGRRILELAPEPNAATIGAQPAGLAPSPIDRGEVSLRGEIVDYKCYLGAMKPGEGKGHKACAALCIGNGIPPVLVTTANGSTEYLVLTDESGRSPVSQLAAPFAGEPVVVRGTRTGTGAISWLRVRSINRIDR
ncbi:MAG: hypothetical protein ACOYN0_09020 [Phycisphaerales bacterium]